MRSLQQYAGVTPVVFVRREDYEAAGQLLPNTELVAIPHSIMRPLRSRRGWPGWIYNRAWAQLSNFSRLDLIHSLEAYPLGLLGHWISAKLRVPHVVTVAGS